MANKYFSVKLVVSTLALAALTACSAPKVTTDFTFLPQNPVPLNSNFAALIWPSIWEMVPAGGKTHKGTVEYLVEALDAGGNVITAYNGEFTRQEPDIAGEKPVMSELVTMLIATQSQSRNPVPPEWRSNPRYMIPPDASAVRVTIDPGDKIKELYEKNNTSLLGLPAIYKDL